MAYRVATEIGGLEFSIEMGRIARQADGAAFVRYGDTIVLVAACAAKTAKPGQGFFPLTVDYKENTYAAGKIPGGFFKREGRPTEKEVLTSRLIDRPLRPLFPEGFSCETQVIAQVLSADKENDSDIMSITGASAACYCSSIPFYTPVGAVRVGYIDGQLVINPTTSKLKESSLNLTVVGTEEAIVMVEAGAKELSESLMVEALDFGHNEVKKLIAIQKELYALVNPTKREVVKPELNAEELARIEKDFSRKISDALHTTGKLASYAELDKVHAEILSSVPDEEPERREQAGKIYHHLMEQIFRNEMLQDRKRPDGRAFDEIRPITIEVSLLPRAHGSALFTRGETQALVAATLGTGDDEQRMDTLEGESFKRFMLHYNFPPFSVGETKPMRGPGRREIGHGALAERSILPVMPSNDEFPYTVRVVSDIMESNGSSSMATVCGGILALMDAGVPIKAPVAGVAMGLVKEGDSYAILTDIAGAEDHYGDMDFKVAGTENGITGLQMDIKVGGIDRDIMAEALDQAKEGRLFLLKKMTECIEAAREDVSQYAPRIITINIPKEKIGAVIGTGGKVIRGITEQTGVKIDIEDDGKVSIASVDSESADRAIHMIEELTMEAEVGKTYLGTVTRIVDFGAFVEIFPGTEALLHISEVADFRVEDINSELKLGDQVPVKVIGIEPPNKIRLSRRAVLREQAGLPPIEVTPRPPRRDSDRGGRGGRGGDRGGDRGGRDRFRGNRR
ncbi:MAG: polyribonucleotide nucleotidyltransferase [Acidobacteriota bacterium]|jgi:polyribonucleotide nucleotidyltransferase|nr:polyribonucleotide nucleotidyltransferase [Acidobacteriota bacterium]